jgi:hypothetical protein
MSSPPSPPAPHLAEAKPLTFADHVVNIFRLVIKELRSIRADPVMLILVLYAFSISVNTVATFADNAGSLPKPDAPGLKRRSGHSNAARSRSRASSM